ncbi:hypothetical protein [Thermococcus sp.]
MKGAHRIPAVIIITFIVVGVVNYLPTGGGEGTGSVKPAERPILWGLTDPPILQNVSWERSGNVETATLPMHLEEKLEEQLWALGYYPVYANWSDCRWTIWNGRRTYYVRETDSGILLARGSLKEVVRWVNETSKCGKPGGETAVIGPSPEKALAYTTSMIGNTLEKNGVIVISSEWNEKIPWSLANYSLTAGKVKILILIYATDGQANYARSIVNGKTLCITSLGYKALLVLRGTGDKVEAVLKLIEKNAKDRNALCR